MQKSFRKIFINFFLFPVIISGLIFYIYFSYNPSALPKPVIAYFEKSKEAAEKPNSFCKKNDSATNLYPEFSRAINLAKQRLTESGTDASFLEEIISCVDIQYSTLNYKSSGNKIEGKFENLTENQNDNQIRISIDQSYKQKDDLLLAFVLTHELVHAKQFFDFKKSWIIKDCLNREAEAFNTEIDLFTSLNKEEKDSLVARIKYSKSTDTTLDSLNQLIKISTKSATLCQNQPDNKIVSCFQKNNLDAIRKILLFNKNYTAQCNL